eukprot:Seg4600.1 transcript_id=Seg4600.1/GoldUCD/mRNA.D3Y31 product="hypothetical protein" protein_id=Seg4600.1/GoldUCD/D3Y31
MIPEANFKMWQYLLLAVVSAHKGLGLDIAEPFGRVNCKESKIDKNVTLAEGSNAGRYLKANNSITSMRQCVAQCCRIQGCDVAFMVNRECYSVLCKSLDSCAPKQNEMESMHTLVAYVAKLNRDHPKYLEATSDGEPALTDDLQAEYFEENPFSFEQDFEQDDVTNTETLKLLQKHGKRQMKDLILAVGCGLVAVVVGVAGVIMMTRKLVEDESRGMAYDWMSTKRESAGM